jgi:hypothetical protein
VGAGVAEGRPLGAHVADLGHGPREASSAGLCPRDRRASGARPRATRPAGQSSASSRPSSRSTPDRAPGSVLRLLARAPAAGWPRPGGRSRAGSGRG